MCLARHVLIVEDHPGIRSVLEQLLTLEGYVVRAVEHGQAALEALDGFRPCVILLDLMMPVLDGWGFLAAYGRLPEADARIITMSAGREIPIVGESPAVDGHIVKPFDVDELLATVERHMARHAAG
jgi:DNA-binding response OmpR family regulator